VKCHRTTFTICDESELASSFENWRGAGWVHWDVEK